MKKLLITGGAGFLGFHICKKLWKDYEKVIIVDIDVFNKEEYPKNVEFFKADIVDKNTLEEVFKKTKPDHVIHGAAALPLYSKKRIWDVNVRGTRNVLELSERYGSKRVVFISSTAVYGVPEKHPLYETDPRIGVGPYGETKIIAEKICERYREKGLCVPIIRPKTFIGTTRLGVFQILYDWVDSGTRIPIIGNGKNHYQLLEVEDLVDAIGLTLKKDKKLVNETFNVGAEEFHTVHEDVGELCRYAGSGARVLKTPAGIVKFALAVFEKLNLSPLYKWVYGTADTDSYVSIEKIQEKLGWEPQYSNSQALIRSYQWYSDHKDELTGTGVTHRVAWSQGILGIFKRLL